MLQAIETRYAGCRFRSRLEARWAVFFDTLGIRWEYEPQGLESHWDTKYLPDFFLPDERSRCSHHTDQQGIYVEVKGSDEQVTDKQRETLATMVDYEGPCHKGLLLLGPIPNPEGATEIAHALLFWHEGVMVDYLVFGRDQAGTRLTNARFSYLCPGFMHYAAAPEFPDGATWEAQRFQLKDLNKGGHWLCSTREAYTAARSARFEHGESG